MYYLCRATQVDPATLPAPLLAKLPPNYEANYDPDRGVSIVRFSDITLILIDIDSSVSSFQAQSSSRTSSSATWRRRGAR